MIGLNIYIDAVKRLTRARENLIEYETVIYSPSAPSGEGFNATPASHDKLGPICQKHEELLRAREDARRAVYDAYCTLEAFGKTLGETEQEVLILKYRRGWSVREMAAELHICERSVKEYARSIRNKFYEFAKNIPSNSP